MAFMAGSSTNVSEEKLCQATKELEHLKEIHGFVEPNRGDLSDESIQWRNDRPNYTLANLEFFKGKSCNHPEGSLERIVEDLVKTWEMEASHKVDFRQWTTVSPENYQLCANGGNVYRPPAAFEVGNYIWLLDGCPKDLFDSSQETFETSHELFRGAFPGGFPWELVQVFSGPPKVAFTWRHWATFDGKFRENIGTGEQVEMYGFAVVTVDENLKIENIEVFYKPNEFIEVLQGKRPASDVNNGVSLIGKGCPFKRE